MSGQDTSKVCGYSDELASDCWWVKQKDKEIEQLSEIANKKSRQLDWLWANCRIIHWPETGEYPFEHNPRANKDSRESIESCMNKELSK